MLVEARNRDGDPVEVEVYVELDWAYDHAPSGSLAIRSGPYLSDIHAWHDGVEVVLTAAERDEAMTRFPFTP